MFYRAGCSLRLRPMRAFPVGVTPDVEGHAKTVEAAVHECAEYIVGKDPSNINDIWQMLYRTRFYRGGPIMMSAIAGIHQALWDIKGKAFKC